MNSAVAPWSVDIPKLPLWNTIGRAYSSYFYYSADVLRISWLWLVLCAPLVSITTMTLLSFSAGGVGEMNFGAADPPMLALWSMPIDAMVLKTVSGLVPLLASISIAVAWHRRIILDEHPAFSGSNLATKSVWRYAGIGFAIAFTMVPGLILLFLLSLFSGMAAGRVNSEYAGLIPVVFSLVFIVVFAFCVAVILRLSLLLPARAIGDLELTFTRAWTATRRNTWRLFWGIMVCMMLPLLFLDFVLIILGGSPGPGGFHISVHHMVVTIVVLTLAYLLLMLPIGMGFLSLAYRHFFGAA